MKNKKKTQKKIISFLIFFLPIFSFAEGGLTFGGLIYRIYENIFVWIINITITLVMVAYAYSVMVFILSKSDSKKEKAKDTLFYGTIAVAVAFSISGIVFLLQDVIGGAPAVEIEAPEIPVWSD